MFRQRPAALKTATTLKSDQLDPARSFRSGVLLSGGLVAFEPDQSPQSARALGAMLAPLLAAERPRRPQRRNDAQLGSS